MLAEELARADLGDSDLAPVLDVDDLDAAREDDEERVRLLPLLEHSPSASPAEVAAGAHELEQRPVVRAAGLRQREHACGVAISTAAVGSARK